jgi:hypothetical protein
MYTGVLYPAVARGLYFGELSATIRFAARKRIPQSVNGSLLDPATAHAAMQGSGEQTS